jgi:hypothetical protein
MRMRGSKRFSIQQGLQHIRHEFASKAGLKETNDIVPLIFPTATVGDHANYQLGIIINIM